MTDQAALTPSPFEELCAKIDLQQEDFLAWWTRPDLVDFGGKVRVAVLAEAQAHAEQPFEDLTPDQVDHYGGVISGWLPLLNKFRPTLTMKYKVLKALIGRKHKMLGESGFPYKDFVEGDDFLSKIEEAAGLCERLTASMTHQLSFLTSQNYRIKAEIQAAIYANNPSQRSRT